jgi:hypothetical protein
MTPDELRRDALSWNVQLKFAKRDAAHAQMWLPKTFPQRVAELHWTRCRLADARRRALAAGIPGNQMPF